ncbi:acyltransferase family protein [Caballeronia zhejiangensis]|uniref:acyltransferase family protein n=1 Tax=Caballeronia zhejiangensis TaxID=871203 RepID=UPI00158D663E|nr:acyltransferase [Caballeronia zhejiangensis]
MNIQSTSNGVERADSVDVLRGIAACLVVCTHLIPMVVSPLPNVFARWSPLRLFLNGHAAVIVFFVLSGFALTCMLRGMRDQIYARYVAARIARLYPAYILSILYTLGVFAALAAMGFQWEYGWMGTNKPWLSHDSAIGHALMIGVFGMGDVNPVIWSLVYEMRLSILFPAILWLVSRFGLRAVFCFVGVSVLYWLRYSKVPGTWPIVTPTANILETFHYATFFAAGSWIALNLSRLRASFRALNAATRAVLIITAIALYTFAFDGSQTFSQRALSDLVAGVGAMILVIASFDLPRNAAFGVGRWLGKISYSLYLTHVAALNACVIALYPRAGGAVTAAAAIVLSLVVAAIFERFVEAPSISLSRYIARRSLRKPSAVAG